MELRLLEYFIKVCEESHFTRAAEKLGISQPTLSHQIRLLEARLNTQLLQRTGKKVFITQAGEILLEHARRVFYELSQAETEIKELQGLLRGKLSVGCAGNHILTSTAVDFHKQYPGIELSIMDLRTEETIEALLNHQLDIGVIFLSKQDERMTYIHLFDEEFFLVVSTNHKLANVKSVTLQDLQSLPLALLPEKYLIRQFFDEYCHQIGVRLLPKLQLSSFESLRQILYLSTAGTIFTQSYLSHIKDSNLIQIPIIDPIPRKPVGIVHHKDAFYDTIMKTFVQCLVKQYT